MPARPEFTIFRSDHVGFSVASLDDALGFWVEGLGATLVRTGSMGGPFLREVTGAADATVHFAIVSLAGQTIELLDYRGPERPTHPQRPSDPGFAHLAFLVDNLAAVLNRVEPFGWRPQGAPQTIEAGIRAGTVVVYLVGPDGATIELMQPPPEHHG